MGVLGDPASVCVAQPEGRDLFHSALLSGAAVVAVVDSRGGVGQHGRYQALGPLQAAVRGPVRKVLLELAAVHVSQELGRAGHLSGSVRRRGVLLSRLATAGALGSSATVEDS